MLRQILFVVLALFSVGALYAQQGSIKGTIRDAETKEPIPFANVVVERNGNQIAGAMTDFDGKYTLKPVPAGKFSVKVSYVGYQPKQINGVVVNADKIRFLEIEVNSTSVKIDEIVVEDFKVPLISKDETQSGGTVTSDDIEKMSGRSAESVAATVGGVYQEDGQVKSVRGAREEATTYYIDGIKVRGSKSVPKSAIEEVSVVTGGLAAKYGDATGGIISITTKGPSRQFFGSAELVTSVDGYFDNLAALSLSGPLISKKSVDPNNPDRIIKDPIAGYFLSGEFTYTKDGRPFATEAWKAKDEVIDELIAQPIVPDPNSTSAVLSAEYLREDAFEKIKARQNVASYGANFSGKIDVKTSESGNFTLGLNASYSQENVYDRRFSFFNYDKNPLFKDFTWRAFGRYTHRFKGTDATEEQSASILKNTFVTAQVDYTQRLYSQQDEDFKDDLFKYGYYGQFDIFALPTYSYGTDTASGYTGYIQDGFIYMLDTVRSSQINPAAGRYNELYYENYDPANNVTFLPTIVDLQNGGGLMNGDAFRGYNLPSLTWGGYNGAGASNGIQMPGATYDDYYAGEAQQFRFSVSGATDIGDHEISAGIEFEQRLDRQYRVFPIELWNLARLYMNSHILELDFANPDEHYVLDDNGNPIVDPITGARIFADTVSFPRLVSEENQYLFDLRFRQANELEADEWVNIDGYDPESLDISYFSADELFNSGSSLVEYYGYNHEGQKIGSGVTFNDFFTDTYIDEVGNTRYKREIPAYMPIYAAGYIQDKFAFKDLVFNVGLRFDYYDLNQKVLKDKYLFYDTYKVGDQKVTDQTELAFDAWTIPGNIPTGAVVYVDDFTSSTPVIQGFRDGDTWYDAEGSEVSDPKAIESGKGIQPFLKDDTPSAGEDSYLNAFEDYTPEKVFMPRISFSFPISDEALFFAHYDVLTKRPNDAVTRLDYIDYLYIYANGGQRLNNPDMRPERTTDYELGFQQKIGVRSALKLSAFYKEMRDMSQVRYVRGGYPVDYITYANIDFGTVKGLTASFDMRRSGNVSLRASYTLQFAKGTGSDATTALSLITSGQPNLRTIAPLNFDKRHSFVINLDYRFSEGKDYNGPKLFGKDILANAGMNLILNTGSGTPFSYRELGSNFLIGSINGATMPWRTSVNMRVDKDFKIKVGGSEESDNLKYMYLNVYADISNLLNTRNILGVYSTTGNPDDNGYLTYAPNQSTIDAAKDPDSFINYYQMYVDNPYNYNMPRRIRVGVQISF